MRKQSVLHAVLTIAAAGFLAGCGDGGIGDIPTQPTSGITSRLVGVEVTGQDLLNAGQTAQLVANISLADGTTKSASKLPNLTWRSSNTSVATVTNSGFVVAKPSAFGQTAVITAEVTSEAKSDIAVQATRTITIRSKTSVTGEFDLSQQAGSNAEFVFGLRLTELGGVSGTIIDVWIDFDEGWGAFCGFSKDKLEPTRLSANGTLTLNPLVCGRVDWQPWTVTVGVTIKDDNGYDAHVFLGRLLR